MGLSLPDPESGPKEIDLAAAKILSRTELVNPHQALRTYLSGYIENALAEVRVAAPQVAEHMTECATRFLRADEFNKSRQDSPQKLVGDLYALKHDKIWNKSNSEAQRELHIFLGDQALFQHGYWREASKTEKFNLPFDELAILGVDSYKQAARIPCTLGDQRSEVCSRLAADFQLCSRALTNVKQDLDVNVLRRLAYLLPETQNQQANLSNTTELHGLDCKERARIAGEIENFFYVKIGLANPELFDHLTECFLRFNSQDSKALVKDHLATRISGENVWQKLGFSSEREYLVFVGDRGLFIGAFYPVLLEQESKRKDLRGAFVTTIQMSKKAYNLASDLPSSKSPCSKVLDVLATELELICYGLQQIKKELIPSNG